MVYSTFDWAMRDNDGYYFVLGRTDDVINVAGHRLGTREIEEAVQAHAGIAEVAVVGVADQLKGQVPIAFAVVRDPSRVACGRNRGDAAQEVMDTVDRELGAIGRPAQVHFVTLLPKTRSGKLLRRSIQALAEGRDPGDLTTIEDPGALEQIRAALAAALTLPAARGFRRRLLRVRREGASAAIGDNGCFFAPRECQPRRPRRSMCRSPSKRRGGTVESTHYGAVAVTDREGHVLYAAGDPGIVTFTRSALKPLQAIPFVAGGGVERFGFSSPQDGVAVRQSFRRAAARRGGADMLARSGSTPATCNAARTRRASTRRAARCRRRRRTRRSRTTARASTAACSRTASSAGTTRRATSIPTIRSSRRSAGR